MTSYHRRRQDRERARRMSRRKPAPRKRYGTWASGMYAAVLLVLLVAVILFTRHYSERLAGAYIDATLPAAEQEDETLTHRDIDANDVRDVRRIVRRTIDDAQRAAIASVDD